MRSLERVLNYCFSAVESYQYCRSHHVDVFNKELQLEIPISSDVFEIPALALIDFIYKVANNVDTDIDTIAVCLKDCGYYSRYKSLDSIFKEILDADYSKNHLVKINLEGLEKDYYGSFGTIFNKNYVPIMMLSWQVQRVHEETIKYKFLRPLLRIDTSVFINKSDVVERALASKILNKTIALDIDAPSSRYILRAPGGYTAKVEIDTCPFKMRATESPSVSTTNRDILNIALEYLDEVMQ